MAMLEPASECVSEFLEPCGVSCYTDTSQRSSKQRRQQRLQKKEKQLQLRLQQQAAVRTEEVVTSDGYDTNEDEDEHDRPPFLEVRASTIPNAGDGLFLASRFCSAGTVLLEEEAIAIRRPAARKILNTPKWRGTHPVIQLSGDRFLDISHLKLYKSNHCPSTSPKCNACVLQTGPVRLVLTARRNIWPGEEILWEYSATMTFS